MHVYIYIKNYHSVVYKENVLPALHVLLSWAGFSLKTAVPSGSERFENCFSENKYLFAFSFAALRRSGKIRYGVS